MNNENKLRIIKKSPTSQEYIRAVASIYVLENNIDVEELKTKFDVINRSPIGGILNMVPQKWNSRKQK